MSKFILSAFADEAGESIDEQIAALQANNIPYLEPRGIGDQNISDLTPAQVTDLARRLADGGIGVFSIGSPIGKIKLSGDFAADCDRLRRTLDTARALSAKYIRMFSFYPDEGTVITDHRDEVMEKLAQYIDIARGSGVTLAHENEGRIYGESIAACIDISNTFGAAMPAVLDPCNYILAGFEPMEAYNALRGNIAYLHIKDGRDGQVVPPGEGVGNLRELLVACAADRAETVLSLEPHLMDFIGLTSQHQGEAVAAVTSRFATQRAAFDYAATALKGLL